MQFTLNRIMASLTVFACTFACFDLGLAWPAACVTSISLSLICLIIQPADIARVLIVIISSIVFHLFGTDYIEGHPNGHLDIWSGLSSSVVGAVAGMFLARICGSLGILPDRNVNHSRNPKK